MQESLPSPDYRDLEQQLLKRRLDEAKKRRLSVNSARFCKNTKKRDATLERKKRIAARKARKANR